MAPQDHKTGSVFMTASDDFYDPEAARREAEDEVVSLLPKEQSSLSLDQRHLSAAGEKANTANHSHSHHHGEEVTSKKGSFGLLLFCFMGIVLSFVLNGVILEKVSKTKVEMSMIFISSLIYTAVARIGKKISGEQTSKVPQRYLCALAAIAFLSTWTSMFCLRYVSFPARVLGKSCKSIPVMIAGTFLGKRYTIQKYLSVILISLGVSLFMFGKHSGSSDESKQTFMGIFLLGVSLAADGLTGALEDKFMAEHELGPFELMYQLHVWRIGFTFVLILVLNEAPTFIGVLGTSWHLILALGLTGALGQVFIFYTIGKFGALTTSIIGTCRKVFTVCASVVIFGHVLTSMQHLGLLVTFAGIVGNMLKGKKKKGDNAKQHAPNNLILLESQPLVPSSPSQEEEERLECPGLEDDVSDTHVLPVICTSPPTADLPVAVPVDSSAEDKEQRTARDKATTGGDEVYLTPAKLQSGNDLMFSPVA